MSENLSDHVREAIQAFYASTNQPVLVTGMVVIFESVDGATGENLEHFLALPGQTSARSLGLVGLGDEWVRDDMRTAMLALHLDEDEE